jgi:DNA replication and repair protein RecF
MGLAVLRVEDLRCLRWAELELHPRLNLIWGPNASGKTSLLEAAYLLGRGRSFRTRHTERLIRHGQARVGVAGQLETGMSLSLVHGRETGTQAQLDRVPVPSLAALAAVFPVQVIDPGIHRLIEEGPSYRRRWLDWGVFHVEPEFAPAWTGYARALRQRNAALRQGLEPQIWESDLVGYGLTLTAARTRLVDRLQLTWRSTTQALLGQAVDLSFTRGWSEERGLEQVLAEGRGRDQQRGMTLVGPHRCDVVLKVEGRSARETLSRGQQKLLGAAMALTLAKLVMSLTPNPPTLLLDDPAAELDRPHAEALLAEIRALHVQMVATALQGEDPLLGVPDRVFHVEQGSVKQL